MLKPHWLDDAFAHELLRYLAGLEDPYEALETVRDHVRHVHADDSSLEHAQRERGVLTGTPVGCACGDGLVDSERVARR